MSTPHVIFYISTPNHPISISRGRPIIAWKYYLLTCPPQLGIEPRTIDWRVYWSKQRWKRVLWTFHIYKIGFAGYIVLRLDHASNRFAWSDRKTRETREMDAYWYMTKDNIIVCTIRGMSVEIWKWNVNILLIFIPNQGELVSIWIVFLGRFDLKYSICWLSKKERNYKKWNTSKKVIMYL